LYNSKISFKFAEQLKIIIMADSIFFYLLESSVCLLLFIALYRLFFSGLTHFTWMRFYMIATVSLSLILPLIIIPVQWNSSLNIQDLIGNPYLFTTGQPQTAVSNEHLLYSGWPGSEIKLWPAVFTVLMAVYFSGAAFKLWSVVRNLRIIKKCISCNPKVREENYWIVNLQNEIPAFSFMSYIFINKDFRNLSDNELQRIRNHELVHIRQHHSFDILFIELASVIFWFNPLMRYIKITIQEIHEFIVDEKIAGEGKQKKEYAQLLLNLTSESGIFNLSAGFAGPQIRRRIIMMNKQRSQPVKKAVFILMIPVIMCMVLSFSYLKNPSGEIARGQRSETAQSGQETIGDVIWTGNKAFSTDKLNEVFGLKKGDNYTPQVVNERLKMTDIADLYLDNGFIFFRADYTENHHNDVVDLTISIYEGKTARIGVVTLKANVVIGEDIRKLVNIHPGDLFRKSEVMKLVQALSATGKFDKEKINPKPSVNQEKSSEEYPVIDLLVELTGI
jgi:hypothetical protein